MCAPSGSSQHHEERARTERKTPAGAYQRHAAHHRHIQHARACGNRRVTRKAMPVVLHAREGRQALRAQAASPTTRQRRSYATCRNCAPCSAQLAHLHAPAHQRACSFAAPRPHRASPNQVVVQNFTWYPRQHARRLAYVLSRSRTASPSTPSRARGACLATNVPAPSSPAATPPAAARRLRRLARVNTPADTCYGERRCLDLTVDGIRLQLHLVSNHHGDQTPSITRLRPHVRPEEACFHFNRGAAGSATT